MTLIQMAVLSATVLVVLLCSLSPMDTPRAGDVFSGSEFSATSSPNVPPFPDKSQARRNSITSNPVSSPPSSSTTFASPSQGPVTRSSRKRKLTSEGPTSRKPKMAEGRASDDPIIQKMTAMFGEVRKDIARSEESTVKQIDKKLETMSTKLTVRLDRAETDLTRLSSQLAASRNEFGQFRDKVSEETRTLSEKIEAVEKRLDVNRPRRAGVLLSSAPIATGANATQIGQNQARKHDDKYWEARRTLRMWPIRGPDFDQSVRSFLGIMLKMEARRISEANFTVKAVSQVRDSQPADQVLVTFDSVSLRDEVKSLARNLAGQDRSAGTQLEAPDHLRGQFQAFQSLAWQMKKKSPALKRNIKFNDAEQSLVMDVKISAGEDWKTIFYQDARSVITQTRTRASSFSRAQLAALVTVEDSESENERDVVASEDDRFSSCEENDSTIVDISDSPNSNKTRNSFSTLSFINANARSLIPKVNSLFDCFVEKQLDLAFLTETWFQDGRILQEKINEYEDNFSLGTIFRNRDSVAANGRKYGGIAFFYRRATSKFDRFELVNPEGHEVLATVGRIVGVRGKVFCITCYAPPNLTQSRAQQLIEYVSDVVSEAKRRYLDCSIILCGDFNQWSIEQVVEDHPDLSEVCHGATRGELSIDRSFTNFGRSLAEFGTLEPLETDNGAPSDHRIAHARAQFVRERPVKISYSYRAYTDEGADKFCDLISQ